MPPCLPVCRVSDWQWCPLNFFHNIWHTHLQGYCSLTDVPRLKHLLEKLGLYRRLHAPAVLLRQQERAIRRRMGMGLS
jgi:hypothetical protein